MKQYFAVMYLNGGNAVVSKAFDSEDEVREKMGKFIENHPDEVKSDHLHHEGDGQGRTALHHGSPWASSLP